jgi:hypothetical protein
VLAVCHLRPFSGSFIEWSSILTPKLGHYQG